MKKIFLPLLIAFFVLACQKDKDATSEQPLRIAIANSTEHNLPAGYELPYCVIATETPLLAGQTTNTGSVTVWNDETNVYVAYQTTGNYRVKKTHLFIGACNTIPVNNSGNPRIGNYPFQANHGTGVAAYVYTIPRSSLPEGCLCVSAHAEVVAYGANGSVVFSQTGWGQGEQINDGGSWAMKFGYCQQDCDGGPR
jgi:hypothetical protein